jgi:hypothetical protein
LGQNTSIAVAGTTGGKALLVGTSGLGVGLSVVQTGVPYVLCPASATTPLGVAGAVGDVINSIVIVPATTSPGAVQIKDGAGAAITIFAGGATSVADLKPFAIPFNVQSMAAGGWSVVTGANVSAIATGNFA